MQNAPLLEYNFLKAVPGSVQHNTAVDSVTKVPIISGKELKSMKNDLQFRSHTPFRRLKVQSHRSRDRVGSPVSAILANLIMEYVEEKALLSAPNPPKWWLSYIDDSHV